MPTSGERREPSTDRDGQSHDAISTEPSGGSSASEEIPFSGTSRFVVKGPLGRGGMGVVVRAQDLEMGREVALKTLPRMDPNEVFHLKEEFRALRGITHENLIELYDLVASGDHCFFTMEIVEGADFCAYVRGGPRRRAPIEPGPAMARLASATTQLVRGLTALHAAGKLHRDIKPSNVRVTKAGRAVLLDFGLAMSVRGQSDQSAFVGTPPYMSPEQAWGQRLSPAADWYQVGVVLYEALTGERPFHGTLFEIIEAKQKLALPRPSERGAPPDLDDLVMRLLSPDPKKRPSGGDILAAFASNGELAQSIDPSITEGAEGPFVGRVPELAKLEAAYARAASGRWTLARVEGPSGMGKSELCRRFLAKIEVTGALVLRGRCHPQESVPYKAFDGIVDDLSRALVDLRDDAAARLAPQGLSALLRVFPVLGRVDAFTSGLGGDVPNEPHEVRRLGFDALAELFERLSARAPLVVFIDDLQWSDADSGVLFERLLRGSVGSTLFLVAYRSEDARESPLLRALDAHARALPPDASVDIQIGPLSAGEARALSAELGGEEGMIAEIAQETAGSPLFVAELSRYRARADRASQGPLRGPAPRLADMMIDRIDHLSPDERRLLSIVSTAGGRIDRSLALTATGLGEQGRPFVQRLSHGCLVRTTEIAGRPAVETYHDKVRECLLASMEEADLRRCHADLVAAFRALPDPDPEALMTHCEGAGDRESAAGYAVKAADRAAQSLAFERASRLYERALTLGAPDPITLRERLAECLVDAGRGIESPPHFLAVGRSGARDAEAAITLRRKAAEQLVRSGRLEDGIAIFSEVFAETGLSMPASNKQATLRLAWGLGRLFLRGIDVRPKAPEAVSSAARLRIDALWGACSALGVMDPPRASALAVEHLLEALDAGDPERIAHGFCHEAVLEAAIGGATFNRRALSLLDAADALVSQSHDPVLRGFAISARGAVAWQQGRFEEAYRASSEGVNIYTNECRGTAFHRVAGENYALSALAFLGDMTTLAEKREESHRRARGWGDDFGTSLFQIGQLNLVRLAQDDPDRAIAEASAVQGNWPLRRYHHTIITAQAELYRGAPEAALSRLEAAWPGLVEDGLLRLEFPRIELHHLRARAEIGSLDRVTGKLGKWRALRQIRAHADVIAKSPLPPAAPFRASILAGIAAARGEREEAATWLSEAARGFGAAKMRIYEEACRMAMGEARAGERMKALGVREEGRMMEMVVPWLDSA